MTLTSTPRLEGGLAARGCPADTRAVLGTPGPGGAFDFDPKGVGVRLCVRQA